MTASPPKRMRIVPEEALYQAVGQTVVVWAMIEITLDTSIAVVFQKCGGDQINAKIPMPSKGNWPSCVNLCANSIRSPLFRSRVLNLCSESRT